MFALCKDHKIRMWLASTYDCVMVADVVNVTGGAAAAHSGSSRSLLHQVLLLRLTKPFLGMIINSVHLVNISSFHLVKLYFFICRSLEINWKLVLFKCTIIRTKA